MVLRWIEPPESEAPTAISGPYTRDKGKGWIESQAGSKCASIDDVARISCQPVNKADTLGCLNDEPAPIG